MNDGSPASSRFRLNANIGDITSFSFSILATSATNSYMSASPTALIIFLIFFRIPKGLQPTASLTLWPSLCSFLFLSDVDLLIHLHAQMRHVWGVLLHTHVMYTPRGEK